MKEKNKIILWVFILFFISVAGFIAYDKKDKMDFQKIIYGTKDTSGGSDLLLKCSILTSIEERSFRMTIYIPCHNSAQKIDLEKILPKIKHGFIISLSNKPMQEFVKQREFRSIKKRFLSIINDYTSPPVTDLYLEHFFLG